MQRSAHDLQDLSVLLVFAHPDDEGFGTGGILSLLASRGARLTLVCATNGDVGEISDPALATPETLAQVRQEELRQAMGVTGVQDVRFLNYRDSGMAGSDDNRHPKSLFQAPQPEVVGRLVEVIRDVRPRVVITHDPTGGYGHPDHVTVYRHVTEAFRSGLRLGPLPRATGARRSAAESRVAVLRLLPAQLLPPHVAIPSRGGHPAAVCQ